MPRMQETLVKKENAKDKHSKERMKNILISKLTDSKRYIAGCFLIAAEDKLG